MAGRGRPEDRARRAPVPCVGTALRVVPRRHIGSAEVTALRERVRGFAEIMVERRGLDLTSWMTGVDATGSPPCGPSPLGSAMTSMS